jgi:ubiquinone/menaquinone biosynthesis C-methylase UbiE
LTSRETSGKEASELSIYDIGGLLGTEAGHFGGTNGTEKLIEMLPLEENHKIRVLEIGCGTGTTSCTIARRFGCKVTGIDLSPQMINAAKKRAKKLQLTNINFKVANALNLPFEDNLFDIVIAESATGVIPDRQMVLAEYIRVTKEGGTIGNIDGFLTQEAPQEVENMLRELIMGAVGTTKSFHIPTLEQWKKLFEEAGITKIKTFKSQEKVLDFTSLKVMRKTYGIFGLIKISFKLFYYILINSKIRTLFRKIRKAQKIAFTKDGDRFTYVGYFVLVGINPTLS